MSYLTFFANNFHVLIARVYSDQGALVVQVEILRFDVSPERIPCKKTSVIVILNKEGSRVIFLTNSPCSDWGTTHHLSTDNGILAGQRACLTVVYRLFLDILDDLCRVILILLHQPGQRCSMSKRLNRLLKFVLSSPREEARADKEDKPCAHFKITYELFRHL